MESSVKKAAMLPQFSPEIRAQAGSDKVKYIPATAIFDLQQIREHYDSDELQQLADRIPLEVVGGAVKLDLMHAVTVAEFDDNESLTAYLRDHAEYYEYPYSDEIIDTIPTFDGARHLRVSGHRRGRAIALKCEQNGIPIGQVDVCSTVLENPTFDDARRKQFVENTASLIQPAEDARAMWREYKYRWHEAPNIVADRPTELHRLRVIAEYMGFSEEKVQNGLLYSSMPEQITQFYTKGLTYSHIVNLAWLQRAYAEEIDTAGRPKRTPSEAHDMMYEYFKSAIVNRLTGNGTKHINEKIIAKVREVKKQSEYLTGELFLLDEAASTAECRQKVNRDLVGAVMTLLDAGIVDFDVDDLPKLEELLEKTKRELGERAVLDVDNELVNLFDNVS